MVFDSLFGGRKRRSNKSSKRSAGRKLRKSAKRRSSKRVRGGALVGSPYSAGAPAAEEAFGGMLPENFEGMKAGEAEAFEAGAEAGAAAEAAMQEAPVLGGGRRRSRKGRKSMDPGMGAAAALLAANIAYGKGRKSRKQRKSRKNRTSRRR